MIPKNLSKAFKGAIESSKEIKEFKRQETKEERLERIMKQLGIQKHGSGKRKKKGGKRK